MLMADEDHEFEVSDNPCKDCGETDWNCIMEEPPHNDDGHPVDNPTQTRHLFVCQGCGAEGLVREHDDGTLVFARNFSKKGMKSSDGRYSR